MQETAHTVLSLLKSSMLSITLLAFTTELYYITGGSARGKKVSPKTWRISAFADARLTPYGSSGSWYFPLTRLIFEVGSTFTPPWF